MRNLVFVSIATNPQYWEMAKRSIASVHCYTSAQVLLFTDCPEDLGADRRVPIASLQWPEVTMARYELIRSEETWLAAFSHIYWLDADMEVLNPIADGELMPNGKGVIATEHYWFKGQAGTPDQNPASRAFLPMDKIRTYFTGSFQGGSREAFLKLCWKCYSDMLKDKRINYVARWHDESYLNRYLYDHPPIHTLRNWEQRIALIPKDHENRPSCSGRTLIAILTCNQPEYKARVEAQQPMVDKLRRILDYDVEYFDGQRLKTKDDYLSLPHKTRALCRWAYERLYTRMLRMDDDSWVNVDQFWAEHALYIGDYAGCIIIPRDSGGETLGLPNDNPGTWPHPYCAGGGYWLSRRGMKHVIDRKIPANVWNEDRWVGHVLAEAGVQPVPKGEYNFYPRGTVLKMNVPNVEAMNNLCRGGVTPSFDPKTNWKEDFLSNKVKQLNKRMSLVAVCTPDSEQHQKLRESFSQYVEETVDTTVGKRILFCVHKLP